MPFISFFILAVAGLIGIIFGLWMLKSNVMDYLQSEKRTGWYDWYAWYPVWLEDRRRWEWLEYVARKGYPKSTFNELDRLN